MAPPSRWAPAARAASVQGVDADPAMVARARELTAAAVPVRFTAADALTGIPPGRYDVITCVATLHHLPSSAGTWHRAEPWSS